MHVNYSYLHQQFADVDDYFADLRHLVRRRLCALRGPGRGCQGQGTQPSSRRHRAFRTVGSQRGQVRGCTESRPDRNCKICEHG